jgi:oligopeptide/dipeptide ABC transporter ATP-binding protein
VNQQSDPILRVKNVKMHFPITAGFFSKIVGHVKAVDDVNFTVFRGQTLSLVGESGCGKTTLGRCIVRIYDPVAGQILYSNPDKPDVDLAILSNKELRPYRLQIRMVFQDPFSSLNPRMTVKDIIGEPMTVNNLAGGSELEDRIVLYMKRVGLRPEYLHRYPHAFSGGERQRIGIARALIVEPQLVVADEAVSALDVSVQAQILNLLKDLQSEMNLTYLFIAHNLSTVKYISDRIAVMYVGKIVELCNRDELFINPRHPYTEALLAAVPKADPAFRSLVKQDLLKGEIADPAHPPTGCYFHPRCPYARPECSVTEPPLRESEGLPGHWIACHHSDGLPLRGINMEAENV